MGTKHHALNLIKSINIGLVNHKTQKNTLETYDQDSFLAQAMC